MDIPRIQSATPKERHFLVVLFSNGERKRYDITRLTKRERFFPLKNPAFFKNVSVEPGGYAVSWNSEIDISEYELWKHGEDMP
ncbi:MAG: DUF2442 domain-containing protein [Candidatus Thiosymbion ectosymbiont of Robbea hypermnestra]|nr:DUF2442 domain-containing protein [Candidatus Thiosymbion ectosymbiont of Robbea hypermnestra]